MHKVGLLITGGEWNTKFASSYCQQYFGTHEPDCVLAVDAGIVGALELKACLGYQIHGAFGDMDSVPEEALGKLPPEIVTKYPTKKDYSDTHLGVLAMVESGITDWLILGATGTRMDHTIANLRLLAYCESHGIHGVLVNPNNRIRIVGDRFTIRKEEQYGTYVSFLPYTDVATGITLSGYVYPLTRGTLTKDESIGISNEILAEEATVTIETGMLYMIESRD